MQQHSLLATKLHIPPIRPELVSRPRLIERLNAGLHRKLTLVSAPTGFGKTTLVSEWVQAMGGATPPIAAAWLSLDEADNDPTRFLTYLVAALQTIATQQSPVGSIGEGVLGMLRASQPQPLPTESILTSLINEVATIRDSFILVLDDYHVIEAEAVDKALTFILDYLPPQMHLAIVTREDPQLPLARYRVRDQLTEVRVADLRFTPAEAAAFLNQVMGLNLSVEDIAALETRTEGWIAGLQLAALALQGPLSMQGHKDAASFIESFTGSHHFVLDYLIEEVLHRQPASIQTFLLRTSILDRLCGSLCEAVVFGSAESAAVADATRRPTHFASGQETLEYLERANLFIVPLDSERRWYRYHHLFADLLQQRLGQGLLQSGASPTGDEWMDVAELHLRASQWYEDNDLEIEAFHHAAAANDIERAERLMEGDGMPGMQGTPGMPGMPLTFRGAAASVLKWLESLSMAVLDARPSLWVTYASTLLTTGQQTGVEEKLRAAEAALEGAESVPSEAEGSAFEAPDDKTQDLLGRIAALRATLAVGQHQVETAIAQSRRALEYLHPDNLPFRTSTTWTLGYAHHLQGDRAAARRAYSEVMSIGQSSGNLVFTIAATTGLGNLQEAENQLYEAAKTYRRVLQLVGDPSLLLAGEAQLGLARVLYQWNDLDAAEPHGLQSLELARQIDSIDTFAVCGVFLARLKLAQGDAAGAEAMLTEADQFVRRHDFAYQLPEVTAAQVRVLLCQGNLAAAADLAEKQGLPRSQARVYLAQGDTGEALAVLESELRQAEAKGWQDERLKILVLQAVAHQAHGERDQAAHLLADALALAKPGGFIRIFVDEGLPMAHLLSAAAVRGVMPDYVDTLLAAFDAEAQKRKDESYLPPTPLPPSVQPLIEPLTPREREVLQLIAAGLSNPEIAEELVIAVTTVKTHVKNIYGKLQVTRRFEAAARAQDLNLL